MLNSLDDGCNNSDPTNNFCLYYNVARRENVPRLVPTHYISLSLDEGTRKRFDGVRLVVVRNNDREWYINGEVPVVTDWPAASYAMEKEAFNQCDVSRLNRSPKDPLKGVPSARMLYKAHQSVKEEAGLVPPGRLATIVLELTAEQLKDLPSHERNACFMLTPLRLSKLPLHNDQLVILHNGTYSVTAPDYSRLIRLNCSWMYSPMYPGSAPRFLSPLTDFTYSIKITSLHPPLTARSSYRRKLPTLPPSIISQIALHALDIKPHLELDRYWATPLLSYALVQKSWVHPVVELFWNQVGSGSVPVLNFPGLVRCLKAGPGRVHAIRKFDFLMAFWYTQDFQGRYEANLDTEVARAFFWTATELREVTVDYTFLREAADALGDLKYVECLCVTAEEDQGQAFMPMALLSLCGVLKVVQKWSRLEKLEINDWADARSGEDIRDVPVPYSLQDLRLIYGPLYGPELLHLTSQQPSTLTSLLLESVNSLSNSRFREFLLQVRGSLEKLELWHIEVKKNSGDEESALDSCISEMQRLVHLTAPYGILTNRGISRKGPAPSDAVLRVEDYPTTAWWETPEDIELVQAVEEGHWKEIQLRSSRDIMDYRAIAGIPSQEKQKEVMNVARRKGIRLRSDELMLR